MAELKTPTTGTTAKLTKPGAPPAEGRPAGGAAGTQPLGDTAKLQGAPAAAEPSLAELVVKAKAAHASAAAPPPARPSLAIPGVPTGQTLPVQVKAAIKLVGTARVNQMSDDACEIRLSVKGTVFFKTIERDVTVSLSKQADGSYLYRYRDEKSGETSEGVATNIDVQGNVRKLNVKDTKSGEAVPIAITDMGGGRFKIAGDGFEADINKI
jgi:hypothetical protein